MKKFSTFVLLTILIPPFLMESTLLSAQSDSTSTQLHELLSKYEEAGTLSGSILVAVGDEVLLKNSYGFANRSWNIQNDNDTKFMIASLSKHFTANIIIQLYEQGSIQIDSPIGQYIPELEGSPVGKAPVRSILNHSSGIQRSIFNTEEETSYHRSEDEILEALKKSELLFTPNTSSSYSNAGFVLLAIMAERVTGCSFSELLKTMIFDKARMKNSGLIDRVNVIKKLASGYDILLGEAIHGTENEPSVNKGASSVYSTINDLHRYDRALYSEIFISDSLKNSMQIPNTSGWGIGWRSAKVGTDEAGNDLFFLSHSGDADGFSSHYTRFENDSLAIIMLSNQDNLPRSELVNQIIAVINGNEPAPIQNNYADSLYIETINHGIERGVKKAEAYQESGISIPGPIRMNFTANQLLRANRSSESKLIHSLIIKLYPEHYIGYAGLGLILRSEGNLEEALSTFRAGLNYNPKNQYLLDFIDETEAEMDQ